MNREIMQQALDALSRVGEYGDIYRYKNTEQSPYTQIYEAIDAINEALAHPKQDPVAWIGNADFVKGQFVEGRVRRVWWECNTGVGQPLYTKPPRKEWVGMTDEDAANICMQSDLNNWRDEQVIDAVEAKLKEKNNAV